MAVTAAQLVAKVGVEGDDSAKSKLTDVGSVVSTTGGIIKNALGGALSFAAGAAGQAIGFLGSQLADSVKDAMAHQQVMDQTAQVVKSTGGAAGMTTNALNDLASSLSHVTKFSDDTIQNGENLLLTFTGIGKDVFPQTTKTMLDMAQAMGGDTKGAAIMLGKALNDPTTGLSALSRVGVTFNDEQKKLIQTYMAHNEVAKAQGVMLQELQREFGGSAEAAGKTFGGQLQIAQNRMEELKQKIGMALLPMLTQMMGFVSDYAMPILTAFGNWFTSTAVPALQNFGDMLGKAFNSYPIQVLVAMTGSLVRQFGFLFDILGGMGRTILGQFGIDLGGIGKQAQSLATGAILTLDDFVTQLSYKVRDFAKFLQGANFSGIISGVQQVGGTLNSQFGPAIKNIVSMLQGQFGQSLQFAGGEIKELAHWFQTSLWPAIQQAMPGFLRLAQVLLTTVVPAAIQLRGMIQDLVEHAFRALLPILEKVIPPMIVMAGIIANDVAAAIKFLMPYILDAAKAIEVFVSGLIDRLAPIALNVFNTIAAAVKSFSASWAIVWPGIAEVLKGVWDMIVGVIKVAWALISGIINIGLDILSGNWSGVWKDIKNTVAGVWDGIKTYIQGALEGIKGVIDTVWSTVSGKVSQPFKDAWNAIKPIFDNISGAINNIKGMADNVKNGATSVVNTITSFLPGHADGIVDNPVGHVAWVGERGRELMYVPRGASIIPNNQLGNIGSMPSSSGSANRPIILQIDGRTFARAVLPGLTDTIRYGVGTHGI